MDCPICNQPFIVVERNKIEFDYCPHKHGIWFDMGELELLPQVLGKNFHIPEELYNNPAIKVNEAPRKCPRCGTEMEKVLIGEEAKGKAQILIDRCSNKHGFWFDQGELGSFISNLKDLSDPNEVQMFKFMGEVFHL